MIGCTKDLAGRMTKNRLEKLEVMIGIFFSHVFQNVLILIQCSNLLLAFFNVHSVDIQKDSRN